ncbi:MAG: hypothetical protein O3A55_07540, partial [Bacteroidetes bacterium]|nr:hypothetical protein [Bacteroidota bacterium]
DKIVGRNHTYSENELVEKLNQAGFKIIEKKYCYGYYGKIGYEILTILQFIFAKSKIIFQPINIIIGIILLPIIILTVIIDNSYTQNSGNGILFIAKKD